MLLIKQGEDLLLNEVELARELNVPKQTLDSLRLQKDFPYHRLTIKDRVYRLSEVLKWLEAQSKVY